MHEFLIPSGEASGAAPADLFAASGAEALMRLVADSVPAQELLAWANAQVGKTQRIGSLQFLEELPRSAIGKVLKRELRAAYGARP